MCQIIILCIWLLGCTHEHRQGHEKELVHHMILTDSGKNVIPDGRDQGLQQGNLNLL